jgi:hypothetical protein
MDSVAILRQCALAGVTRSTFYTPLLSATPDEEEFLIIGVDFYITLKYKYVETRA